MDIALQSLQRREDIVEMKFTDIVDDHLFVVQQKTEKHGETAYLKIKIDKPFKEVINRCRDGILCPYLIHRYPSRKTKLNLNAKSKKHPAQITPDYLTKTFSKIRDKLKMFQDIPIEERPTFHEIRSLGIMLYEKQGIDAQALAGHTTREMTEKYKDSMDRSSSWA